MKRAKNVLFIIFLVFSIALMYGGEEARVKKSQFIGNYFFLPYTASILYIENLSSLTEENQRLNELVLQLQYENIRYKEAKQSRDRALQLVDKLQEYEFTQEDVKVARVIGTTTFVNYENLLISLGIQEGITPDLPIIAEDGLVGKLVSAYPSYSVVQSFRNRYFRMGAVDARSRVQGIVETDALGKVFFTKIKVGADLMIGDTIETSNLSSIFPAGIPFGEITSIEQTSNELFVKAEIRPFVELSQLEYVAIVVKK
ncbi:MAG: rod shape-determining protein MreC [Candidatus Cloacimonadia bacterium]